MSESNPTSGDEGGEHNIEKKMLAAAEEGTRLETLTNRQLVKEAWGSEAADFLIVTEMMHRLDPDCHATMRMVERSPAPPPATDQELAETKKRCEAATPGPWHQCCADGGGCGGFYVWRDESCDRMLDTSARGDNKDGKGDDRDRADAAFIAHARTDLPRVLADNDVLRSRLATAEQLANRLDMALQSLTPGGSEYHNDPERCVAHVRERLAREHEHLLKAIRELDTALAALAETRKALKRIRDYSSDEVDDHYIIEELKAIANAALPAEPPKEGAKP